MPAVALDGTAEDFGTAAGYCRELLSALDALSPGGHPARAELQAKLLINIATEIAVRQTELASMRGGSRAAMQASVQRVQVCASTCGPPARHQWRICLGRGYRRYAILSGHHSHAEI